MSLEGQEGGGRGSQTNIFKLYTQRREVFNYQFSTRVTWAALGGFRWWGTEAHKQSYQGERGHRLKILGRGLEGAGTDGNTLELGIHTGGWALLELFKKVKLLFLFQWSGWLEAVAPYCIL